MAYDINQLLDNLPSLLMQHNRDQEAKRQFDVTTDKTEDERLRNYGINKGDYDIRVDQANRIKREQKSMDMVGQARKLNLDRNKAHEDMEDAYLEGERQKTLLRFLPKSWSDTLTESDFFGNQKQAWLDDYWGEGSPERYVPDLTAYNPETLALQDKYNRPRGSKRDDFSLLKMLQQGKY